MSRGKKKETTIKVGLVGFGSQGKWHFERLWSVPPFEVVWVFDRRAHQISKLPSTLIVHSTQQALRRDSTLVVIATPPSTHFCIARFFLLAGKNIILEKPTAISDFETRRLLEIAQRRQQFILTHFSRRWDPDFLAVKEALSAYDFGRVHEIESRVSDSYALGESYPGRHPWKLQYPGGGILLDWGPHLLDQLFELMGHTRPEYIYCHNDRPNRLVDPKLEEQFTIHVKYRDCLVVLNASWNAGLPRPRWVVCGTRAALLIDQAGHRAAIRWRRGDRTVTKQLDMPDFSFGLKAFRALVKMSTQDQKILINEAKRMRMVSYAIDLARRSYLTGKILAWKL